VIKAALDRINPGSPPEVIAADACAEMVLLPSVDSAIVIALHSEDHGYVLAAEGPAALAFASNRVVPASRARYLWARASDGVWIEDWRARPEDGGYGEQVTATGLRTVAYAPLRGPGGLIGLVAMGMHETADQAFIEQLPVLTTLASILVTLLAPRLDVRNREDDARAKIQAILDGAAFTPFFQPIAELRTGDVVGHETLSRFANGDPPDVTFELAARCGLGLELETATMSAALKAAAVLPPGAYLSLNASPALIRSGELGTRLRGCERSIVLEITEHVAIEDYRAIRDDLAALGPTVRLAVDDAGAGYASMRHILELAPDFVKLDISLVRQIDADPARQALVAGMGYFAAKRRMRLVAEGIETAAELDTLRSLGISYGQGYLLGRPRSCEGPGPWPTTVTLPAVAG
jgi:EAL domain-containing protein (putative c-di-GMP-specific phosphodiesterase class I)